MWRTFQRDIALANHLTVSIYFQFSLDGRQVSKVVSVFHLDDDSVVFRLSCHLHGSVCLSYLIVIGLRSAVSIYDTVGSENVASVEEDGLRSPSVLGRFVAVHLFHTYALYSLVGKLPYGSTCQLRMFIPFVNDVLQLSQVIS